MVLTKYSFATFRDEIENGERIVRRNHGLRKFAKVDREKEDVSQTLLQIQRQSENLLSHKDPMRSPTGKPVTKKEIWISESDAEEYTGDFNDALTWTKRLGTAAMLGFPVFMKQITRNSINQPTHDFWVSILYKSLVGRAVLESRLVAGDKNTSYVFAHCTEMSQNNIIETDFEYERGAVTMFGVNLAAEEMKLNIKASYKEEPVHIYILTAENKNKIEDTYLNGQLLKLSPSGQLPVIMPKVKNATRNVQIEVPPKSVFFVVLPEIKAKQCTIYPIAELKNETTETAEHPVHFDEETMHAHDDDDQVYVRFGPKKKKKSKEDPEGKEETNEIVAEKSLRVKFPIPEAEISENKELDRPTKSIRDQGFEAGGKNKINKMSPRESKLDKIKNQKKELIKNAKHVDPEDNAEVVTWNNNDKDLAEAMLNTKFVMFSDDDWLSNFSHAKKAVEAAKKIIEAFDEAEYMKKKDCEPLVLKVENDKYHIQYGKDGQRKKKFAVLSGSVPGKENNTNDDTNGTTTLSPQLTTEKTDSMKQDTTKPIESEMTVTDGPERAKTTHEAKDEKEKSLQGERQEWENNEFNLEKHHKETASMSEKRFKRELYEHSASKDYTVPEDLGIQVPFKNSYANENTLLNNNAISKYSNTEIQKRRDLLAADESEFDGKDHYHEEEKINSEAYRPGEFYEHRNLQKVKVNTNSDNFEDLFEAESSGRNEEENANTHNEKPSEMSIVSVLCKDGEQDKTIKDKVEADLKQYYKTAEKLASVHEELNDYNDVPMNERANFQNNYINPNEQRLKRTLKNKPSDDGASPIALNSTPPGKDKSEIKNMNTGIESELKNKDNFSGDKPLPQDATNIKAVKLPTSDLVMNSETVKTKEEKTSRIVMDSEEKIVQRNNDFVDKNELSEKREPSNHSKEVDANNAPDKQQKPKSESQNSTTMKSTQNAVKVTDSATNRDTSLAMNSTMFNLENEGNNVDKDRTARENPDLTRQENIPHAEENSHILATETHAMDNFPLRPTFSQEAIPFSTTHSEHKVPLGILSEKNQIPNTNSENEEKEHGTHFHDFPIFEMKHKTDAVSKEDVQTENEEKYNLDIVCGRTKNFGTFCVGSEHKFTPNNDDTVHSGEMGTKQDRNQWETQRFKTGLPWTDEMEQRPEMETSHKEESQKSKRMNKDLHDHVQESTTTCKASRSAPYVEDFEELLSQMDEIRKDPNNKRHRRLVHFTVPAISMKPVDEKYDEVRRQEYDENEHFHNRNLWPNDMDKKEGVDFMTHNTDNRVNSNTDKLIHDLNNEYDEEQIRKEQIKRTITSVPAIKPKRKPHYRNEDIFGPDMHYQDRGSDMETMFGSGKKSQNRNMLGDDQFNSNDYKEPYAYPRNRKPTSRDEFNDYDNEREFYFQKMSRLMKDADLNIGSDGYNERYYKNGEERREWGDKVEKGYVRLPGDVYSQIEGARGSQQRKEPYFTKSEPIEVMPVAMTSPEMLRPKFSKTSSYRAKRSSAPYFRNVRNDIAAIDSKLIDTPQLVNQKKIIHSRSPKVIKQYDLYSKGNSMTHHIGLGTGEADRIIKESHRIKRSWMDINNIITDNEEAHRSNEILKNYNKIYKEQLQKNTDEFDKALLQEKNKQFQSLTKKLSDLAKLYAREKDVINDRLTIIVDDKDDEIETSNGSKLLLLSDAVEMNSPATEKDDQPSEIGKNSENHESEIYTTHSATVLADENKTNGPSVVVASVEPSSRNLNDPLSYIVNQMRNLVHYVIQSLVQF